MVTRARVHVGVGGPVGTGKTALIEAIVPRLVARGEQVLIVTNELSPICRSM
jgi:urease accessory protein